MNSSFRFAHISDLHLTSLDDVKVSDLLNKRALGYLSWRRRRRREHSPEVLAALLRDLRDLNLDHIVITGDLTHIGLPSEFQQARQWLEALGAPTDVTVVPGNHDAYVHTAWDKTFALWTPYMASDPGLQTITEQGPGRELFPSVRLRRPAALIGLTSACPSAPFLATGSLGPTQLKRLDEILVQNPSYPPPPCCGHGGVAKTAHRQFGVEWSPCPARRGDGVTRACPSCLRSALFRSARGFSRYRGSLYFRAWEEAGPPRTVPCLRGLSLARRMGCPDIGTRVCHARSLFFGRGPARHGSATLRKLKKFSLNDGTTRRRHRIAPRWGLTRSARR
jgi:Calcineurin-like phosphoesterase